MIEAYKIAVDLVMDQGKVLGPLGEMIRGLKRLQEEAKNAQIGLNQLVSGIRGAQRLTDGLAGSMERVARAAAAAAASSQKIKGGNFGDGGNAGNPGSPPSGMGASSAPAARSPSMPQLLLTYQQPQRLLGYSPGSNNLDITGRTPMPMPGTGYTLVGSPSSSNALVPSGPLIDHSDVVGRSPDRGALVPYVPPAGPNGPGTGFTLNGGSYVPPIGGLPTNYVPPPPPPGPTPIPLNPTPTGARPYMLPGSGGGINPLHAVAGAAAAGYAFDMAYRTAESLLDPSLQVAQAAVQIGAQTRLGPDAVNGIIGNAFKQQRNFAGSNVIGNLNAFRMLFSLTQNAGETNALLPSFLPVGLALQAFNPEAGSYDTQLEGVFKSAEFMGAISVQNPKTGKWDIDASKAGAVAKQLLSMEVVSNGAVDPNKYLAFLRSGGTAAANMDPSEMAYLLPIIQALNPRNAGQGLKSFEQQFSSGKMSGGVLEMLTEMGIIKNPGLVRPIGIGQFMLKPGALDEKTMMQAVTDPIDFFRQTLLPDVDKYLGKNYGDKFTKGSADQQRIMEGMVLQQISSRIPSGTLLGEMLRNWPLMLRDNAAVAAQTGADPTGKLNQSPLLQLNAFNAALQGLLATFGGDALKQALSGIGSLVGAMNALEAWGQAHPDLATQATNLAVNQGKVVAGGSIMWAASKLAAKVGWKGAASLLAKGGSMGVGVGELLLAKQAGDFLGNTVGNAIFGPIDPGVEKRVNAMMNSNVPPFASGLWDWTKRQFGYSSAPTGAPPPPIATKDKPLPVQVVNPQDIARGATSYLSNQAQKPPSGPNFGTPSLTPIYPGMMGGL